MTHMGYPYPCWALVEMQHCMRTCSTAHSQVGQSSRGSRCCVRLGERAGSRHVRLRAIRWNDLVTSCDAACRQEGWSGCDSRCCMRSGGTVRSRAVMLHADWRAGRVATHDAACDRVEWSGRASQSQGHGLRAIRLRAELQVAT